MLNVNVDIECKMFIFKFKKFFENKFFFEF